jgi:hypothetical protein
MWSVFEADKEEKNTESKREGGEKIRNEKIYIYIYYNNDERFPCTDSLSISTSKP